MKFRFLVTWLVVSCCLSARFSAFGGEFFVCLQRDTGQIPTCDPEEHTLVSAPIFTSEWNSYVRLDFPGEEPFLEKPVTLSLPETDPEMALFPVRDAWVFGTSNRDIPSRVRLKKNAYRRLDLDGESWFGIMRYNLSPPPEKNLATYFLENYTMEELDAICDQLWAGRHRTTQGVFAMGVPEPTTWILLALGLFILRFCRTAAGKREKSDRNIWI